VLSLPREKLVPVLYQHLLINLKRAGAEIRASDFEAKAESLSRASEIVHDLLAHLDFEVGGGLAPRLASLYAFWIREIGDIGRQMDADRLDRLVELISPLYASWVEASNAVEGEPRTFGGTA
jgi:flagellar protein FliS